MAQLVILTEGFKNFLVIFGILMATMWCWKMAQKKVEWFSQHIIPENPRKDRNISEDVLIYDYDEKYRCIGYYVYNEERWMIVNDPEVPKNFKWRYFDIDIDEP